MTLAKARTRTARSGDQRTSAKRAVMFSSAIEAVSDGQELQREDKFFSKLLKLGGWGAAAPVGIPMMFDHKAVDFVM